MADISIHWSGLAKVAEVSLVFGVGIVVVFALGVIGLAKVEQGESSSTTRASGYALAGTSFLLCAAAVAYGLYLIIPQFHHK